MIFTICPREIIPAQALSMGPQRAPRAAGQIIVSGMIPVLLYWHSIARRLFPYDAQRLQKEKRQMWIEFCSAGQRSYVGRKVG